MMEGISIDSNEWGSAETIPTNGNILRPHCEFFDTKEETGLVLSIGYDLARV